MLEIEMIDTEDAGNNEVGTSNWSAVKESWRSKYWVANLFISVQLLSRVRLFATPWIAARPASLSITNSRSSLKLMSIELVMLYSHLIFCHPLLLLPSIPPSIRVFSNESTLPMTWRKYWSFSFSLSPSNEHPGLEDLQDLLEQTPKKDVLFIIGDWNAKIGRQETPGVTPANLALEYGMKQGKG